MTQLSPEQSATETLDAPAPRWTPEKQGKFLEALARCGSVKSAAAFVGMSRESAHRLRRRTQDCGEGRAFARAWDAALIHARDLYAEEVLEKGLNGWNETVWYHGEEVGERQRFSVPLLLAALGRLDKKADECDLAGHPARAAAAEFDEMVEAISQGSDCAAMLEEQDKAGQPDIEPPLTGIGSDGLLKRLREKQARAQIAATAPDDIDISDLDPNAAADWDDMQWERAMRSGMNDDPDFWRQVRASEAAAGIVHEDGEFKGSMPGENMAATGAQDIAL
ncbi:hypothetical protein [Parasphingorhabdus cellanae]|uniref:Terminase n=1 Tax=Parasphingorhabdus cellanae TaxID=2806553 RepID=A0ABX7T8M1_9SPHN|nr:hypothetical protein [Parasphingorhabdus cellanae]QTD57215.1 hypothetical protein J4G78_06635 [Parasphingorhabdus cellanae]